MSPAAAYSEPTPALTAQRGGLGAPLDLPRPRMTPAEIPLTLSADVLRLPYTPAIRLVLAEIVSLFAANGCCDASDPHFAARLTINKDTVSVAIAKLEAEGLIGKVVVPVQGGKYRTLTPIPAAIAAKAATNSYPEVEVNTRRNFRRAQDGNSGLHTPEITVSHAGNSGFHTPEIPVSQTGNSGGNTPVNIPVNFQVNQEGAASAAAPLAEEILEAENPELPAQRPAAHTEGGAADVATSVITKKRLLMRNSPVAAYPDFLQAWQDAAEANPKTYAPYAQADLLHYHTALLSWSNADGKTKFDWLSTILGSMRRDDEGGRLRRLGAVPGATKAPSQVSQRQATSAALRARYQPTAE